jgi:hypothetical protein
MTTLIVTGGNMVDPRDGSISWSMDVTVVLREPSSSCSPTASPDSGR